MAASAISHWKMFRSKYNFQKISCFDIQWHVFPRIKCITHVQELSI